MAKDPLSLMRFKDTSQSLFAFPRALKALCAVGETTFLALEEGME
jgi:hypothetical protein